MAKDTLIGAAGHDSTWLRDDGWVSNLFLAERFEGNDAAMMVKGMKQAGHKCHTEPLAAAVRRCRDDYVLVGGV